MVEDEIEGWKSIVDTWKKKELEHWKEIEALGQAISEYQFYRRLLTSISGDRFTLPPSEAGCVQLDEDSLGNHTNMPFPAVVCPKCGQPAELVDADHVVHDETGTWYTAIYTHCEAFRIQWPFKSKKGQLPQQANDNLSYDKTCVTCRWGITGECENPDYKSCHRWSKWELISNRSKPFTGAIDIAEEWRPVAEGLAERDRQYDVRTHEGCAECYYELLNDRPCEDHPPGPIHCYQFKPKDSKPCPDCDGSGDCPSCAGQQSEFVSFLCIKCKGIGKCPKCNGSGKRA
jgi:hypothetical protein